MFKKKTTPTVSIVQLYAVMLRALGVRRRSAKSRERLSKITVDLNPDSEVLESFIATADAHIELRETQLELVRHQESSLHQMREVLEALRRLQDQNQEALERIVAEAETSHDRSWEKLVSALSAHQPISASVSSDQSLHLHAVNISELTSDDKWSAAQQPRMLFGVVHLADERSKNERRGDDGQPLSAVLSPLVLERLSLDALGRDADAVPLTRVIPVTIYLRDGKSAAEIEAALEKLLRTFDLDVFFREAPVRASFFKRLWAKTVNKETVEGVRKRLDEVEEALRIQQIKKPESEAERNRAEAAAALITALGQEQKSLVVNVGNLLIVVAVDDKGDKHQRILTLTDEQVEILRGNPALVREPEVLMKILSETKKLTGT